TMEVLRNVGRSTRIALDNVTSLHWFRNPSTFGLSVKLLSVVYILIFAAIDWLLLRVSYYHQSYRTFSGPLAQLTFVVESAILLVCAAAVVGVYGKKARVLLAFEFTTAGCVALMPLLYIAYCVRIARGTADGTANLETADILFLYALLLALVVVFAYTCLHAIRVVDAFRRAMKTEDARTLIVNEPEFV
ncbi:hypothetical protein PFISCL1PPCAC_13225, partial [Pristionchus fissidentatus]